VPRKPLTTPLPNPTPGAERVTRSTLLSYGPPLVGLTAQLFFVQFFFLKFATDVLLLAPAAVGVLFALGRLWDAVSDPLVGAWSDRTRTRLGRRRPWMLGAIPPLGLSFVLIWTPPTSLSPAALAVWVAGALFAFYTAFTAYAIPHVALGAELSDDHHDRSRVYGARAAAVTLGMLPAFATMQLVNNAEDPRAAAAAVAVGYAALGALLLLVPLRIPERSEFQGRARAGSLRAIRGVLRNRNARRLLGAQFIDSLGIGVLGVLAPYFAQYVLRRPDLIGPLPAVFVVCNLISIPFWVRVSRRFGKRDVWRAALVGVALAFGGTLLVGEGDVALIFALLVAAGAASGCGAILAPSMLADVIDADELETGERREGAYLASWGLAFKTGNALMIAFAGLALELAGFVPNQPQAPLAEWTLRALFGGAPLVATLTGAWILGGFRLDDAEHRRIRSELARRR
jgi:GPH family glycoside/pentoside/hexuronide:cation symporter